MKEKKINAKNMILKQKYIKVINKRKKSYK